MAKISELPIVADPDGSETVVALKGGVARRVPIGDLVDAKFQQEGAAQNLAYRDGQSVADILDQLLYSGLWITTMTVVPAQAEIGSTVATVTVSWTVSGPVTAQTLEGVAVPPADRAKIFANVSANNSYDLVVTDGDAPGGPASDSASATIAFLPKWYAGVLDVTEISDAELRGFASQGFATGRGRSLTFNASAGGYPYYAWPAALGALAGVTVGGLAFTDFTVTTRDVVNASGATVSMHILRFNTRQTGAAIGVTIA